MSLKEKEIYIDSISPNLEYERNQKKISATPFGVREIREEKRIDKFHTVIHVLAFIIILPYILLILVSTFFKIEIPTQYSTVY